MDLQAHAGPEGSTRTTPRRGRTARRCEQRVRRRMRTNLDRGSWPWSPAEDGKNKTRWLEAYRVSLNSGGRASGWESSRSAVRSHTTRAANPPLRSGSSMRLERVVRSGTASWDREANTAMGWKQRTRCVCAAAGLARCPLSDRSRTYPLPPPDREVLAVAIALLSLRSLVETGQTCWTKLVSVLARLSFCRL